MVEIVEDSFYKPRYIYSVSDPSIANGERHYLVCITVTGEGVSMACCTSQIDSQRSRIAVKGFHENTLVLINHQSSDNNLRDPTCINCNFIWHYEHNQIAYLNKRNRISIEGEISNEEYLCLLKGFILSDQIDMYFQRECNDILNPD